MNVKKIMLVIVLLVILIGVVVLISNIAKKQTTEISGKLQIVSSNFASYDFLRAIIGDNENVELTFLLGAGKDTHSYDPTAQDLIKMQNADLFVYVGGEMESWAERIIPTLKGKTKKILCISDDVLRLDEQEIDGAEKVEETDHDEHSFDEHIWTSPENAILMINSLEKAMEEIDNTNKEKYRNNADNYIADIKNVDNQIQEIVDNKVRNILVFGDKMPMQYLLNYYNLEVSAAFSGCSTETEPSAQTIAYLVQKVKEENIPVVLYVELNNGQVAETIASEAENGSIAMQIQSLHNITKIDFENGETWVTLMQRNINVLRKALQ